MNRTYLTLPTLAALSLFWVGPGCPVRAAAETTAAGSPATDSRKMLSPYFLVLAADGDEGDGEEAFPLKSTDVEVRISGVIAEVTVRQVYHHTGTSVLEAIYVFPASTRAAVHGMTMRIGDRLVDARVKEREEAKQIYEQAKVENKSASLLEQQRPNIFQMNVAHILPGDRVEVNLRYTEHLVPADRVYEFVYPTVVAPRYSNTPADSPDAIAHAWVQNPYLEEGVEDPTTFDIHATVNAGMPLQQLVCQSHGVNITYTGPDTATVALDGSESHGGDRDYVLRYQLADESIASGLLLHRDEDLGENFFLLTVQPPERVRPEHIPAREYLFVIDVSGSMRGFPLNTANDLMRELADDLQSTDSFNILLFAGGSKVLAPRSVAATPANVRRSLQWLDSAQGGGGTEMVSALRRAVNLPGKDGVSRTMVVITDGLVSFERDAFELVRKNLGKSNVFAFGIGSSVNRYLIEGLARAGRGEPFVVTDPQDAAAEAAKLRAYISAPVLTDVEVDFGALQVYDVEPASVPDVLADRPVTIFGKWRGRPDGAVTIHGISGNERIRLRAPLERSATENPALPFLWARDRIASLSDFRKGDTDPEVRRQIVNLGLTYNLLTRHTSFVAVDEVVRARKGAPENTVHQPLPLPQGVPATAVGGGTVPEPRFALLILIVLAFLLLHRRRFSGEASQAS